VSAALAFMLHVRYKHVSYQTTWHNTSRQDFFPCQNAWARQCATAYSAKCNWA